MKDKADNSRERKKDELTQTYKSYADYAFKKNETHHPCCENVADYVLCFPTNDECKWPNWKCVLWKCTACNFIAISGVERDPSNQSPMIMFNTYTTQCTCSHYGIIIHGKITTYLDEKGTYKRIISYVKINPSQYSLFHTLKTVWESKTVFHSTQYWWVSQRLLY